MPQNSGSSNPAAGHAQGSRPRNGSLQNGVFVNNRGAIGTGQPLPATAFMNPLHAGETN
jgi:hypothetical protein